MSLPVVLRPETQADLLAAQEWYERQREGLGNEFVVAAEEIFELIGNMPEIYPLALKGVRRGKLRRFPYVVYYRVLADRIEAIAVLHGSRNPQTWQDRA